MVTVDGESGCYSALGTRGEEDLPPLIPASACAAYAQAAYRGTPTWTGGDCYAYCFRDAGTGLPVVAFRGTDPSRFADILSDLDALGENHPQLGRCHRGFLNNVVGVYDVIKANTGGRPLTVVGHSKGAAEAALFAGLMAATGRPPMQLTTFGMPRIGAGPLRALLTPIRGEDYRNGGDPVTQVPLFFSHPRALRQLGSDARLAVQDHYMAAYAKAVAAF
jgi:hypothetical protein